MDDVAIVPPHSNFILEDYFDLVVSLNLQVSTAAILNDYHPALRPNAG